MPALLDTDSRVGALTRAVEHLLAEHGPTALTMRAIARRSGVGTSSMLHHLDSRERMLVVCAHRSTQERLLDLTERVIAEGPLAVLPDDERDLRATRCWLGWLEAWRTQPSLGSVMAPARRAETALLSRAVDHVADVAPLTTLQAVVDGLRVSLCLPGSEMSLVRAQSCLAAHLGALLGVEVERGRPIVPRSAWRWPYVPGPRAVATGETW